MKAPPLFGRSQLFRQFTVDNLNKLGLELDLCENRCIVYFRPHFFLDHYTDNLSLNETDPTLLDKVQRC